MVKSPTYDENGMKKGAWSKEEDEKLIAYIQKYGHWNWRQLPKYAGLARCGKSCRLRWMNYLRPNLKHGNYTKEEEEIIIKSHEELGNKWSVIAARLPGRSDNEIKNYWNSRLKNRLKRASSTTEAEETTGKQIEGGGDSETENPPMIFESCNTSSAGTSSGKNAVASPMSETFEECSGNFWTDPFVPDSTYYHQDNYWEDYDCIMRDCSCHGDETDLYYQVMQELPKND